ncbi:hypothetical protein BO70DRAFT_432389 [Aspergillus heteromorphus CBS 117.55]|uniref:Berberine/berberine-like domain-containing protein n=1 Tax=Aspergillus heteromorphus CBS 117.55 TaxID=1448321 RepID=A0A317VA39_9EURO|nr:uncharacterized protein BO70DRAFT_432389 [Aspergillus heteromorphus CBS 117.55]PWY69742.1 hypothetical protein BO70DRAFT_432389 [Aspergillus heteromorphus CBS 117.55]
MFAKPVLLLLGGFPLIFGRPECRCQPNETCWPADNAWAALNDSIHGHLVQVRPVGNVCHEPFYDEASCREIARVQSDAKWHAQQPGALQNFNWENWPAEHENCTVDGNPASPCEQGRILLYSAVVHTVEEIQEAVKFAMQRNIRLVIKNTGHDSSDMFWALRGGGGGTYGIVTRATLRAFPDMPSVLVTMQFTTLQADKQFWYGVTNVVRLIQAMSIDGNSGQLILRHLAEGSWTVSWTLFFLNETDTGKVNAEVAPYLRPFAWLGIRYQYNCTEYPKLSTYLSIPKEKNDVGVGYLQSSAILSESFRHVYTPGLSSIDPSSTGVYFNEADPDQTDVPGIFWGPHYGRLRRIKDRWDAHGLFVARNGVGSEGWDPEGICRKPLPW